jgi:hypothetical protein
MQSLTVCGLGGDDCSRTSKSLHENWIKRQIQVQQQAFHHVSNDPDCLKVGSVDKEKLPESRGQTRGRRSSLEALKVHVFTERPAAEKKKSQWIPEPICQVDHREGAG